MRKKLGFLLPGIGVFIFSMIMMFSGAFWPEYGETTAVTGLGFVMFFFSLGYLTLKTFGLVVK